MYCPRRCLKGLATSAIFSVPVLPRAPPLCCSNTHTRLEILTSDDPASHYPCIHYSSALFLWDVRLYWYLQEHWDFITMKCCHIFSHPEPKLLNFMQGKTKEYSHCEIRSPVHFNLFIRARFLFCSKVQNIIVTAVSDVDYMLSGSGATLPLFCLQLPPAAAVIQFWYRPAGRLKELLPHPDMWTWPWRPSWLAENSVVARLFPRGDKCARKYGTFQLWRISR